MTHQEDRAADYDYLVSKGASMIQALAWCASFPRGASLTRDMDEYLQGGSQ